jgi:hypothetical protein
VDAEVRVGPDPQVDRSIEGMLLSLARGCRRRCCDALTMSPAAGTAPPGLPGLLLAPAGPPRRPRRPRRPCRTPAAATPATAAAKAAAKAASKAAATTTATATAAAATAAPAAAAATSPPDADAAPATSSIRIQDRRDQVRTDTRHLAGEPHSPTPSPSPYSSFDSTFYR